MSRLAPGRGIEDMVTTSKRRLDWPIIGLFVVVHLVAFGTMGYGFFVEQFAWQTYVLCVCLFYVCHISTSAGMHMLYSHRAYKASQALQLFYVIFAAAVVQGPARWWAAQHMQHHGYTDMKLDPHSPMCQGFWYAHIGWMIYRDVPRPPRRILAGYRKTLDRYPLLKWQSRYYVLLVVGVGFALPTLIASLWGDALGGFLLGGFVRLLFQYHTTWSVNSLSHMWGRHLSTGTATDSHILALLNVGEAYHATHHKWPYAMLGPNWYSISMSKWFIVLCKYLGLVSEVKFVPKTA